MCESFDLAAHFQLPFYFSSVIHGFSILLSIVKPRCLINLFFKLLALLTPLKCPENHQWINTAFSLFLSLIYISYSWISPASQEFYAPFWSIFFTFSFSLLVFFFPPLHWEKSPCLNFIHYFFYTSIYLFWLLHFCISVWGGSSLNLWTSPQVPLLLFENRTHHSVPSPRFPFK